MAVKNQLSEKCLVRSLGNDVFEVLYPKKIRATNDSILFFGSHKGISVIMSKSEKFILGFCGKKIDLIEWMETKDIGKEAMDSFIKSME